MTVTNQAELEGLQAIGRIVATTLQAMARAMEPGMTTRELDGIGRALLERAGAVNGRYHILGGTLSALDGIGPDQLNLRGLPARVSAGVTEVLLALAATMEGQTTAHYVTDLLHAANPELNVSRLAHGVPVGGELDYLDEGTLALAIKGRLPF